MKKLSALIIGIFLGFGISFIIFNNLIIFYNLPNNAKLLYNEVSSAKQSIYIITYSLYPNKIAYLVLKKAKEGLDVRIIVHKNTYDKAFIKKLRQAGVKIEEIKNVHAKIYIIDGKEVFIGSNNFSNAALFKNIEAGIFIKYLKVNEIKNFFMKVWEYEDSIARS